MVGAGGAHRAVGRVVRVAGRPPAVHGEEGVTDVGGGSVRLPQLLSLRELVEAPLDVEQLRAGLVGLHGDDGGVTTALHNELVDEHHFHQFEFQVENISL